MGIFFVSLVGAKLGFRILPISRHQYITGVIRNGTLRVTGTITVIGVILTLLLIVVLPEPCYSYYMF